MSKRAGRSLKVSPIGINSIKNALPNFGSKIALADELKISRATIQKFFAGKPIGRENFHNICQRLNLCWKAIADLATEDESFGDSLHDTSLDFAVVDELRQKARVDIQSRCGIMRVLDMSQPIGLNDIYINVNILEKISKRQKLEVSDLLKLRSVDEFERPNLGSIAQERVLGVEAVKKYSKLFVLGKPGSGKTTFLKHIALQCINGQLQADIVPIFLSLKSFAESDISNLFEYITEQFYINTHTASLAIKELLKQGKMLILLDGIDEVKETHTLQVFKSVKSFCYQFSANRFIITCRIAAKEYTFEDFTEVEIADFTEIDIAGFATKWFAVTPYKSQTFIKELKLNRAIRDIATNPLMLTFLCLVFEELAEFPTNRSALYQEGLDILLKKWDAKRNIEREQIYKKLSSQHKKDLLSRIALTTFERGDYFFKREEIEQQIFDYIRNLPNLSTNVAALQLDSAAILKSIEAQHGILVERAQGIYSFSHLTFQEYFAAREIVTTSHPQELETALKKLVSHITNKRWREVFLMSAGMLRNADYMLQLMKNKIDEMLADDPQLQTFLAWVKNKSHSLHVSHPPVTIRAFYFDLAIASIQSVFVSSLELTRKFNHNFTRELEPSFTLDLALDRALALNQVVDRSLLPHNAVESVIERTIAHARSSAPQLEQELQQLKAQLPQLAGKQTNPSHQTQFKQWWKANGIAWLEQLREVAIAYRNMGFKWQMSKKQKEALKHYYLANQLLVECLNSNYYVTRTVRSQIEQSLLLPSADLN